MKKRVVLVIVALTALAVTALAGKKEQQVVPQLTTVETVFVKGAGPAADKAREILREGKMCLCLSLKESEAHAVMEVTESAQSQGGYLGMAGGRNVMVSVTITLADGSLVWSDSYKGMDGIGTSGAKQAMDGIFRDLKKAADCKAREKAK